MHKKIFKFIFYIYAYALLFISFLRLWSLFSINSTIGRYFRILYYFDNIFYFPFFLSLCQAIFTIIHFIPLMLYLDKKYMFSARPWKYLFFLRIIFDISGHSFEANNLQAYYYSDPLLAAVVFIQYVSFYIPSYLGCYKYAFKRNNMQLELFDN